jgi:LysM repeat protein
LHQEAATEERWSKLSGQIEDLCAAQEAQQKRIAELATGLTGVREQLGKPDANYASQQELICLANAIRDIDQKRSSDGEQIHIELASLGRLLTTPPPPKETTSVASADNPGSAGPTAPESGYEYVIQRGDTLSAISRTYREKNIKVSVDQILKANPGLKAEKLRPGQKIFIPGPPR